MPRRSSIILGLVVVFAIVCVPGSAQSDTREEEFPEMVSLSDVKTPSLLYRSDVPGRYVLAPSLDTDVEITVKGLLAEGVVVQRFKNTGDQWLEGVYVFPLPTQAAVFGMRLVIGDRIIEGQIKEKEVAKRIYNTAKAAGKRASLVEQERPNIFTTSVANIGPGDEIEVRIEYQETLEFDDGELELRFPMVVGPRYIPGSRIVAGRNSDSGTGWAFDTDLVLDASRITPPVAETNGHNPVHLRVELEAGFPLARLDSAYHPVQISEPRPGIHVVELDETPADRDFVLRWVAEDGKAPRAAVFAEEIDGETFVLAMVVPPADEHLAQSRLPREIVYVIDTSGSMGGASIRQARAALLMALDQLHPEDYFNIIEFDSRFTTLFDASQPAMPAAISNARDWVKGLIADNGTEMMGPLRRALEDPTRNTPLRQVVFITDGCVGNEDALFARISSDLGRSRLFTVGIGSAPNSHFMERAATFGRGSFTYIGSPAEVEPKMQGLFAKIENPVLADIALQWPDPDAETWPQRVPDLYAGQPVVVAAKLATTHGRLQVSGLRSNRLWRVEVPLEISSKSAGINRLWARRKIAALMANRVRGAEESEIRNAVVDVALKHHLVSKYTSLVAVDVTPVRPADKDLKTGAVKTNLPAGWQRDKVFGNLPRGGTASRLMVILGLMMLLVGIVVRRAAS